MMATNLLRAVKAEQRTPMSQHDSQAIGSDLFDRLSQN